MLTKGVMNQLSVHHSVNYSSKKLAQMFVVYKVDEENVMVML